MTRGSRLQPFARAVLRTQSDERLVALAREGREAAFEEIVRRYRPGLVAFAAAYAPASRAEDVVQESLLGSWDALRRSTEEIRLKPWLYTIVRNRALNARRDARPHSPLAEDLAGARGPDEELLTGEQLGRVIAAVNALPDAQRRALVQSALEGRTHEQIAAELDASPGAVRQLIYRGRLAVRGAVGLAIPVSVVRALADAGAGDAAAAAMGGAAAAGAGGASALTKAAVVAVVGAVAIGSGAAIKRAGDERGEGTEPARSSPETAGKTASGPGGGIETAATGPGPGGSGPAPAGGGGGDDDHDPGDDPDRSEREADRPEPGRSSDDDDFDEGTGPGTGSDDDFDDVTGGHGSGGDDPASEDDDHGGGSGSGSSGSFESPEPGHEGSDPDDDTETLEAPDGSSGSGSPESSGSDHELDEPPDDD